MITFFKEKENRQEQKQNLFDNNIAKTYNRKLNRIREMQMNIKKSFEENYGKPKLYIHIP